MVHAIASFVIKFAKGQKETPEQGTNRTCSEILHHNNEKKKTFGDYKKTTTCRIQNYIESFVSVFQNHALEKVRATLLSLKSHEYASQLWLLAKQHVNKAHLFYGARGKKQEADLISSFQKLESNKERQANYRQKKKKNAERWRNGKKRGESGRYHSSVLLGGPSQEVYRRQANRQM